MYSLRLGVSSLDKLDMLSTANAKYEKLWAKP